MKQIFRALSGGVSEKELLEEYPELEKEKACGYKIIKKSRAPVKQKQKGFYWAGKGVKPQREKGSCRNAGIPAAVPGQ